MFRVSPEQGRWATVGGAKSSLSYQGHLCLNALLFGEAVCGPGEYGSSIDGLIVFTLLQVLSHLKVFACILRKR